jgi:hypothetical protein
MQNGFRFSRRWMRLLGISLITLSLMLYGAIFLLPFLPFSGKERLVAVPALVVLGEERFGAAVCFWEPRLWLVTGAG